MTSEYLYKIRLKFTSEYLYKIRLKFEFFPCKLSLEITSGIPTCNFHVHFKVLCLLGFRDDSFDAI